MVDFVIGIIGFMIGIGSFVIGIMGFMIAISPFVIGMVVSHLYGNKKSISTVASGNASTYLNTLVL
ncbi:hypothetical protein [Planococcus beigongshangi]|uniref:hypothetical protein n=1 Tax=Planococcus beigongshangi TaxID=2782536 RepID=UPI00193B352D|nr:hypothetical protein [Planococcus beigongshangi]